MTPKRSKKSVVTPMDQSDSKDLDITPIQIKKETHFRSASHSFCSLTVTTHPAKKIVEIYRKQLQLFYQELQEIDLKSRIMTHKMIPPTDSKSNYYKTELYNTISTLNDIPKSITQISKLFAGGKPNAKSRKKYTNVHFMNE